MKSVLLRNSRRAHPGVRLGGGSETKLGVLLGLTHNSTSTDAELEKARVAASLGASMMTDLSTDAGGGLRRALLAEHNIPIGTVPTYEIFRRYKLGRRSSLRKIVLETIEQQAADGVDFFSIHMSFTREQLFQLRTAGRTIPITSRGGAMIGQIMHETGQENPLYAYAEEIAQVSSEYGVCLSLAASLRPGSVSDAFDATHLSEIRVQGELSKHLSSHCDAQVIAELLNHVPIPRIREYIAFAQRPEILAETPVGALGPSPTDIAVGMDDVAGAIGAAEAVRCGASWINITTAGEHIGLPTIQQLEQAIRYFQLAVHIGDVSRTGNLDRDERLSEARNSNDWNRMTELSICPSIAQDIVHENGYKIGQACTMCGGACPLVRSKAFISSSEGTPRVTAPTVNSDTTVAASIGRRVNQKPLVSHELEVE